MASNFRSDQACSALEFDSSSITVEVNLSFDFFKLKSKSPDQSRCYSLTAFPAGRTYTGQLVIEVAINISGAQFAT